MLQTHNGPQPHNAQTNEASLGRLVDNALGLLRKNIALIFCTTLIGVALGALYVAYVPSVYTADAEIILDTHKFQIFQQQPVFSENPFDLPTVANQVQILKSNSIAFLVVKKLDLANDSTFIDQTKSVTSWFLDLLPKRSGPTRSLSEADRSEQAASAIMQNLKVQKGEGYVIDISFRSRSPERAAQIANAVAEAYFADQMESRRKSMRRTTTWLQDHLKELGDRQRNADRLVADFKAENKIVASGSQSSKESTQVDELSFFRGQVMTARTHLSELQAKVDRIEAVLRSGNNSAPMLDSTDPTVSDELTNPTITRLRDKYLDYLAREKDMSAKYGSNHLAVVNIRQQITALRTSMFDEIKRIAETYKSEYAIAKQHLDDLEKAFSAAVVDSELHTKMKGPLRELENSANSYRSLHDNLLQRYLQLVQEESSPTTEARFLTRASIPTPKSPFKAILIAGLTSMVGFAFGVGIGVFRQMTDRMFRTTDQVESALQIECISVVPMQTGVKKSISKSRLRAANNRGGIFNQQGIMWDTVNAPFSRYAEAIRAVKFAVDSNGDPMASKVIGVTSSIPNEGKSTIAGSLALLAADSGARTILVDCDLRNPRLSRRLAPNAEWGLLDVITGGKSIEEVVITDPSNKSGFFTIGVWKKIHQ